MTVDGILEDLEEANLEVTRSAIFNVDSTIVYTFDLDSKICLEVQQSLENGTEFFVCVVCLCETDICFKNCVKALYWPDGERDYLPLNDMSAKDVLDKDSWPKLLKCLRRMLN